jgi:hypothetical protein
MGNTTSVTHTSFGQSLLGTYKTDDVFYILKTYPNYVYMGPNPSHVCNPSDDYIELSIKKGAVFKIIKVEKIWHFNMGTHYEAIIKFVSPPVKNELYTTRIGIENKWVDDNTKKIKFKRCRVHLFEDKYLRKCFRIN